VILASKVGRPPGVFVTAEYKGFASTPVCKCEEEMDLQSRTLAPRFVNCGI
jgi:hypothetical protein